MPRQFEWDRAKASSNLKKHGIGFDEAITVFNDPWAFVIEDEWHSEDEPRELITGYSSKNRILVTVFIEREFEVVRIVSARKATAAERRNYAQNAKKSY